MVAGALYALVEKRIRKFIAYSSINQMGFLLIGLVAAEVSSIKATLIYLVIYVIMNVALLLIVLRSVHLITHRPLLYLSDFHYLAKNNIFYSTAFISIMFSMAGIPPLAGFFGKYFLLLTGFESGYRGLVVLALGSTVISTFYYLRIIK
jgi:NADH-quinone oxidoreductase subunit N